MSNFYKKAMLSKAKSLTIGGSKIETIKIDTLLENPYQPRIEINEDELEELASSIKEQGLLQPIIVTPKEDSYIIIAGHRRVAAHKLLNKQEIKAIVLKNLSDKDLISYAITENLQRKNLDIIETAIALKQYKEEFNKSFEDIAKELGKAKSYIVYLVNVLKLPQEIIYDIKINKSTTDVKALNMLNTLKTKLSVVLTTEDIETIQKNLYYGFIAQHSNGRKWLKNEIDKIFQQKEEKNSVEVKQTKQGATIRIKTKNISPDILHKIEEYIKTIL